MSGQNKIGFSSLPLLNLVPGREPRMWKNRMRIELTGEALRSIGVCDAPTTKLSNYIKASAGPFDNWFVTIGSSSTGIGLMSQDLGAIRSCVRGDVLHVHGVELNTNGLHFIVYSE